MPRPATRRALIAELRRLANMERECFDAIYASADNPLPKTEDQVNSFVFRRAHFYRGRLNHVCDQIERLLVKPSK
jgi:hypothetical protein